MDEAGLCAAFNLVCDTFAAAGLTGEHVNEFCAAYQLQDRATDFLTEPISRHICDEMRRYVRLLRAASRSEAWEQ